MSFRHIEAQHIKAANTVPLVLDQLRGNPVLHVEHLGDTNADFWSDAIAKANAASSNRKVKISDELIRENRLKNRDTVAKHSVRRLENVFHDDKSPATSADIRDVVFSLPNDVFDVVWSFVNDANNFRETAIDGEPSELAKK